MRGAFHAPDAPRSKQQEVLDMKTSTRFALRTIALALAIAGSAATSSIAHAGAKCPNRFFKKVQVKGIGDTEANAKTAYDDDLAKKIAAAKPDCDKLECEDSDSESCTFLHTQVKKPKCTPQGPGFKCVGWIRPGCFCQDPDEELK
jgi:hypothetical protein